MEAVSRIIQSYWRRRTYQRLEGMSVLRQKNVGAIRLRRRRRRRSKTGQLFVGLRLKVWSPPGLLTWLKDAHVDAILRLVGRNGGGQDGLWGRRIPKARRSSVRPGDFERSKAAHTYNSVTAAS